MNVQTVTPAAAAATERFQALKQLRDEVWVQLHLGKAELRNEWMRLEPEWEELRGKMDKIEEASFEAGKDLAAAARLVMEELGAAYEKIRKAI